MSEEEAYKILTDFVADRFYDNDYLEVDYDAEADEWVLWYQNYEVAHYSVKSNEVY